MLIKDIDKTLMCSEDVKYHQTGDHFQMIKTFCVAHILDS